MSSVESRTNKSFSFTRGRDTLGESEIQRLQRDVDNFTRLLEQEKRRLLTVEEQYQHTLREHKEWVKKSQTFITPSKQEKQALAVKIHSLEKQLEQAIVKYNEIIASNRLLRADVDVIRRERNTMAKVRSIMAEKLEKATKTYQEMARKYRIRTEITNDMKNKILDLKERNNDQQGLYKQEFENLTKELKSDKKRPHSFNRHQKIKEKYENFDTQPIMKRRLQRIILNNKEKVRVIEQYQANMKIIDEAFNIIKETSGITDIEEIMNTFIKSEEQNYSLFNYVNVLTQDIDFLEENNKDLEEEKKLLAEAIEKKLIILQQTPQEELERMKLEKLKQEKDNQIKEIRGKLEQMQKALESCLKEIMNSKFCPNNNLILYENFVYNENTADQYLEVLDSAVALMIPCISKLNDNKDFMLTGLLLDEMEPKDFNNISRLSSMPNIKDINMTYSEESTNDNTRFMDESFIRQIANESVIRYKLNQSQNQSFHAGYTTDYKNQFKGDLKSKSDKK